MKTVGLPYLLTLSVLLFASGIFKVLVSEHQKATSVGVFLMLSAASLALMSFALFLPEFIVNSWEGAAGTTLVMGSSLLYGIRVVQ